MVRRASHRGFREKVLKEVQWGRKEKNDAGLASQARSEFKHSDVTNQCRKK